MERIGIIGLGLMGRGWAIVFARAGHEVTAWDGVPEAIEPALALIDQSLADLDAAGLLTEPPAAIRARISVAPTLAAAVADVDYVQESVSEVLEVKQAVYAELDAAAPRHAILASSTSTIPASAFSADLAGRDRCLVVHPAQPVQVIPVVEVCPAPWTTPEVTERTVDLQRRAGQSPVLVRKEIPGFILNRLQAAILCEALTLWSEGYASADDIDRTVRDGLGLRWSFMGPIETFELAAPAGGVEESARRYGQAFLGIARSQEPVAWTPELMARLAEERAATVPLASLPSRARRRDRRVMALLGHRRTSAVADIEASS